MNPDELTPGMIAKSLSEISHAITNESALLREADRAAVMARMMFKRKWGRAFIHAEGSNDVRRVTADLAAEDELQAAELADADVRAHKEQLAVLRNRLDVGRSMGTIMRLEWGQS